MAKKLGTDLSSVAWVPRDRLRIEVQSRPIRWSGDWERRVDAFWHDEIKPVSPQFFRGPVLAACQVHVGTTVSVTAAFTDYAHFLYARRHPSGLPEMAIRPIFAAALPILDDGSLVICKMSARTERPGRLQCIGGTAIPSDVKDARFCAEVSASREMLEEIGVDRHDEILRERGAVGATVDPHGGVAVVVAYDVLRPWSAFQARIEAFLDVERAHGRTTELEGILAIPWGERGMARLHALGDVGPRYLRRLLTAEELCVGRARSTGMMAE